MKKYILAIILAVLVFIPGCNSSLYGNPVNLYPPKYTRVESYSGPPIKTIPIVVDKNFGMMDKTAVEDAVNAWNYVLNGYVVLYVENYSFDMEPDIINNIINRKGLIILKTDSNCTFIPENKKDKFKTLAWVNDIAGNRMWIVRDRLYQTDLFPILLHEFGHVLGSKHEEDISDNKGFLMYPHYEEGSYNCIDGKAMEKVANHFHLISEKLNYCY